MADPLRMAEVEGVAKSHPSIVEPTVEEQNDGGFKLQFRMKVQDARDGRKNGVLDEEPVDIIFPPAWPIKAPKIRLRQDFCRNIAHINQSIELDPQWVDPCIVDVPLDSFIRDEGLSGLLNQLQEWLDNVAFDKLRGKDGAWEPMRRDGLSFFAIADTSKLREIVTKNSNHQYLVSTMLPHPLAGDVAQYFVLHDIQVGTATEALKNKTKFENACVTLLSWGGDKDQVADIFPDGRHKLLGLLDAAKLYGCNSFQHELNRLAQKAGGPWKNLPVLVIFAVRRPSRISGNPEGPKSNIELLPYIAFLKPEKLHVGGNKVIYTANREADVYPVMLRETASPALLQSISGTSFPDDQKVSILGCGSLGSKIAMHLGKSGFGQQHLVDKSVIMPHNLARMGVMIDHRLPQISKVSAVEAELSMLGHNPSTSTKDIIETASEVNEISLPEDTSLVLDTTASPNVHDALCHYPVNPDKARIAQVAFFASGRVAALALEGQDRGIDIEHLRGFFWRHWMLNGEWPGGDLNRVLLGEGCGSMTMTMSDMQASLLAAGLSQQVTRFLSEPLPEKGKLYVGAIGNDNCSVNWIAHEIPPAIPAETNGTWQVDILPDVADEINASVKQAGQDETGGYLMGRINWVLRRITIATQLNAPVDSIANGNQFILGVEGVGLALQNMYLSSQKAFLACGTWHSHPKGGPASKKDIATLDQLAHEAIGQPMVSLVWRPEGYLALVQQEFCTGEK